jgi:hypothetical protein
MLIVTLLLGCQFENGELAGAPSADFDLTALDAGSGDGRSVQEFVSDELTLALSLDWSFLNLPALNADDIDVSPGSVPSQGTCITDEAGVATHCSFMMDVSMSSTSGWWDASQRENLLGWTPGRIEFCFGGDVALSSEQVAAISNGLEDDAISFSGVLKAYVCRGKNGSGSGLPGSDSDIDVFIVEDGASDQVPLLAADDTIDD